MDYSTIIAVATGVGAAGALYAGLRTPRASSPIPPPPVDPVAEDAYGLAPLPGANERRLEDDQPVLNSVGSEPLRGDGQAPKCGRKSPSSAAQRHRLRWDQTGLRDIVIGLALLLLAGLSVLVIPKPLIALPVAAALGWLGVIFLRRGGARQHGLAVEKKARRSLKLPAGWLVDECVPVQGLGDADMLLTDPDGERFVVEIKAHEAIQIRKRWFSGGVDVRGADGRKLARDPLSQVTAVAGILQGHPVLWFPNASKSSIVRIGRPEVIIVQGNGRQLRKAIGARGGWFS